MPLLMPIAIAHEQLPIAISNCAIAIVQSNRIRHKNDMRARSIN